MLIAEAARAGQEGATFNLTRINPALRIENDVEEASYAAVMLEHRMVVEKAIPAAHRCVGSRYSSTEQLEASGRSRTTRAAARRPRKPHAMRFVVDIHSFLSGNRSRQGPATILAIALRAHRGTIRWSGQ